jgi:hypothetical protein
MARCSGIRADGGRCGAQAIRSSEYCVNHHPDYEDARRRRNSKGGKRGGRGRPQAELADIKRRLSDLADDVLDERVDKGVAAVASQILNVYLRAVSVELSVREQLELVERLEALEGAAEQEKGEKGGRRWGA